MGLTRGVIEYLDNEADCARTGTHDIPEKVATTQRRSDGLSPGLTKYLNEETDYGEEGASSGYNPRVLLTTAQRRSRAAVVRNLRHR